LRRVGAQPQQSTQEDLKNNLTPDPKIRIFSVTNISFYILYRK